MAFAADLSRTGGAPALFARGFAWGMLGFLAAFLINNVLNIGWGVPNLADMLAGRAGAQLWMPLLILALGVGAGIAYVMGSRETSLRWDAMKINGFNSYIIRACFWIVLLTLVMNRLIFHDPMPGKLQPTLVILIAPPAVGFVAWVQLVGQVDAFAHLLLSGAYFFTLIVAVNLPRILQLPFALSFWALSFPFAAVTIASFRYAKMAGSAAHIWIGAGLMGVLLVVIAGLVWRTLRAIRAGEICVPE